MCTVLVDCIFRQSHKPAKYGLVTDGYKILQDFSGEQINP